MGDVGNAYPWWFVFGQTEGVDVVRAGLASGWRMCVLGCTTIVWGLAPT